VKNKFRREIEMASIEKLIEQMKKLVEALNKKLDSTKENIQHLI